MGVVDKQSDDAYRRPPENRMFARRTSPSISPTGELTREV
jgi:hypothetical protein